MTKALPGNFSEKPRCRPVILWESLARVSNQKLVIETLAEHGVPLAQVVQASVVQEQIKGGEIKRRHVSAGRDYVVENVLAKGDVVLLVGNVPLEAITDSKGIKQKRGRPFEHDGVFYLPIMPPGIALYDERTIPMMEADLALFADMCHKGKIPREESLDYVIVSTETQFDEMLADLEGTVSFDIETNGLYPWQIDTVLDKDGDVHVPKVISIGFGTRKRQWCLPLNHRESPWPEKLHQRLMNRIDGRIRHCYTVTQNGKFDALWLKVHYELDWQLDFDTMLAHYMLDENSRHGLKLLAQVYYGAPNYDADLDEKQGEGPLDQHCLYLAHDCYYTRKLRFTLGKELDKDPAVKRVFERVMMRLARLFVDIEYHGVQVDHDRFEEAEVHLLDKLKLAERDFRKILKANGIDFDKFKQDRKGRWEPLNLGSPKQLAKLFFENLKIEVLDKTDKGAPSTSESVLLRIEHPAAEALLRWRGADQLLKMFIEGWKPFLIGGRLHPTFKLHGTVTHRASCEKPNLQQVPRESLIRSLIIAALGWDLLEIDLSQIEMRIAAELSGDPTLLSLFERDEDVHWLTATREISRGGGMKNEFIDTATTWIRKHATDEEVKRRKLESYRSGLKPVDYSLAVELVYRIGPDKACEIEPKWKELRKKAKAINFGYLFGMWWKKFKIYARDNYGVTVTDKEAQESRKTFFSLYPKLAEWHERQRRYARRNGHVRSLSGALRRLPDAMGQDDTPQRAEAQRQAINSPVQEFACMLNYMTLLQLTEEFGWDVMRPVGTIHDAILIECRRDWTERIHNRALEIMRHPKMLDEFGIRIRVPIKGDAKIGPWSQGVNLDKWKAATRKATA